MGDDITQKQQEICTRYKSAYNPLRPADRIAIAIETIGQSPIYGTRLTKSVPGEIEWFVYCGEHSTDKNFYSPVCYEHIKDILPFIEKYLALDTGFNFITDHNGYEDVWQE